MNNFTPIDFHKTRDFSKKLNDTFEFVRQNIKPLGKSILFIAGPPVLIGSLMLGSFMGDFLNLSQSAVTNPDAIENYFLSANFWIQIAVGSIFLLISGVATMATINNYIILYGEKKSNQIEVSDVWERVRQTFWMYLGTMIFFMILFIVAYSLMLIPMFLLTAISPFLIFFGFIGIVCLIFYLIFGSSLTFFIRAYEKTGVFAALSRSFYLVRGKWWSTFGLVFILFFIVMTISYLFIIPWYVVTLVTAFHNTSTGTIQEPSDTWQIMTVIFFSLYYLVQMVLYTLPNIGIAFQYFNLVELKEAKGLMNEIQTFGQSDQGTQSHREEQY